MAYFQTKFPTLGKFWRDLQWKMLVYFMAIWSISRQFHGYVVAIWFILWLNGTFFPFWYVWTDKNLATMVPTYLPTYTKPGKRDENKPANIVK
jgi:hypothetical protein